MIERTTPKEPIELAWDEYVASMEGRPHGQTDAFKFAWMAAQLEQPHRAGFWCVDLTCSNCYSSDFRFKHTTTPPQRTWVGLTDEEIDYIYTGIRAVHHDVDSDVLCRAIEAKLKEKNGA
jgi:hypothetical protein